MRAHLGEARRPAAKVNRVRAALDERVCRLQQQHVALGHERRAALVVPRVRVWGRVRAGLGLGLGLGWG